MLLTGEVARIAADYVSSKHVIPFRFILNTKYRGNVGETFSSTKAEDRMVPTSDICVQNKRRKWITCLELT